MASSSGPGRTGPSLWSSVLLLLLVLTELSGPVGAASEQGKWLLNIDSETLKTQNPFHFSKTLFNNTYIFLKLLPETCHLPSPVQLNISWYLRNSHCHQEIFQLDAKKYFGSTDVKVPGGRGYYVLHHYHNITCSQSTNTFGLVNFDVKTPLKEQQQQKPNTDKSLNRRRRKAEPPKPKEHASAETGKATAPPNKVSDDTELNLVAKSWEDGPYVFILNITEIKNKNGAPNSASPPTPWSLQLEISMKGPHEFISASEWPLMVFYMVMCIVYVLLAVLWLVLSACYWRDLLRIQFWIGGVIFLGMLEKAVYYAEFQSIRYDGLSVQGAVVFAEVLSAVKRTLARVLVIIASLGYGIVKPRLGALLHRVVGVGLFYLIFSIVEGILRVNADRGNNASSQFLCEIVLAFIDSCIAWWISFNVYTREHKPSTPTGPLTTLENFLSEQ